MISKLKFVDNAQGGRHDFLKSREGGVLADERMNRNLDIWFV